MKKLVFLLLISTSAFAQQTINGSIQHGGLTRDYILYVPASYNSATPAPLVFNFHGHTSNSNDQMVYGDFRSIADTAGFLIVHPMGTLDNTNQPYWNSHWGGTVDDIGFTAALIDSIAADYNINEERVYSAGMSNGGFMGYSLACSLGDRISAIASVTGSMNAGHMASCNPTHPTPIMQIHGTADAVVPYAGNGSTMEAIDDAISYWVNYNNTDATPTTTSIPNTNTLDGCTAEQFVYTNGDNGVEIELFKVTGGGHTWPGAPVVVGVTNYDFDASVEIWRFFSQFDINGKITGTTGVASMESVKNDFVLFPNPATSQINISYNHPIKSIAIYNNLGQLVIETTNKTIDVQSLNKGIYNIVLTTNENEVVNSKFLISNNN